MLLMQDLDLKNKRVMVRLDLNVPLEKGRISNDARIRAAIPTIRLALRQQAAVILLSHLGRPNPGEFNPQLSLKPIAERLQELLECPVPLLSDWLNGITVSPGSLCLCENVRFNVGEQTNDVVLAKRMAELCDVFVMDAFATAHRAEASTEGITCFVSTAAAGLLVQAEIKALQQVLQHPSRPLLAVVGGAKVSTKLAVLDNIAQRVDRLIVGGGIANTFLHAAGFSIGRSLYEPDRVNDAARILQLAREGRVSIPLPQDVIVCKEIAADSRIECKDVSSISSDDIIVDIGPKTEQEYLHCVQQARTILWNGPLGIFEYPIFARGTRSLAQAIARSSAFSVVGGGETVAAIEEFSLQDRFSYTSTAGGAFLEFVEGKQLPAIAALESRHYKH